jgi:hypothetical protein
MYYNLHRLLMKYFGVATSTATSYTLSTSDQTTSRDFEIRRLSFSAQMQN